MNYLDLILLIKIAGTGLFVGLPLLLIPTPQLVRLLGIEGAEAAMPLIRLYGWAVLALLVGYSFGLSWVVGDTFPLGVVTMGLVSNAGATVLLVITGAWRKSIALTVLLGCIALAFAFALIDQPSVMQSL
ncbi:hypothetical protein NAP1_09882 [Erythrobacter sp. NAP1]|uniref:hypothetical protein n=1 Tax=Erythrobacter sp. NAP1 TaxID=237727 RepID=UPI0000685189|nr:hypothetical protein [Erythrobacter sp. NAP1]EAQ27895.1 hypothetical protein NAP1_09882 [Erythrobacter sp. NAP1]